jgi:hypothetical protein
MVVLGDDLRLVKITKVEGVGHNFIKFHQIWSRDARKRI